MTLTLGSVFSGAGFLDLGLERAGMELRWHSESDPHAAKVLAHHWPGMPNLGDVTAADWSGVEPVDVLAGGFPCQPFSDAGLRKGTEDERWMWPAYARAVRALRPSYVIVENVSALLRSDAFGWVLADLAEAGYVGRWSCIRACDVGAPHRRERVFIVAHADDHRRGRLRDKPALNREVRDDPCRDARTGGPQTVAHADEHGRGAEPGLPRRRGGLRQPRYDIDRRGTSALDADQQGRQGDRRGEGWRALFAGSPDLARYIPAIERWERLFRPAPDPLDDRGRLNPAWSEWMLGCDAGWVSDLDLPFSAKHRCIGNGVQVQVAELVGSWVTACDPREVPA